MPERDFRAASREAGKNDKTIRKGCKIFFIFQLIQQKPMYIGTITTGYIRHSVRFEHDTKNFRTLQTLDHNSKNPTKML